MTAQTQSLNHILWQISLQIKLTLTKFSLHLLNNKISIHPLNTMIVVVVKRMVTINHNVSYVVKLDTLFITPSIGSISTFLMLLIPTLIITMDALWVQIFAHPTDLIIVNRFFLHHHMLLSYLSRSRFLNMHHIHIIYIPLLQDTNSSSLSKHPTHMFFQYLHKLYLNTTTSICIGTNCLLFS